MAWKNKQEAIEALRRVVSDAASEKIENSAAIVLLLSIIAEMLIRNDITTPE